MAFLAPLQVEVRTTGSDANGGAFDPTSGVPGTDYSKQDAAQVAYTDLVIDAVTNTNCTSAGTPFTAAHVGNVINVTGGTGFTVQRVQIISVTGVIATCDKSLGTVASIGGTGNLGGGLATIGTAGLLPLVAGNTIWIKYHASNIYSSTSTTANVANGRLSVSVGTATAPLCIRGYDVTHGDNTGNRPTLRWGVNAASNYLIASSAGHIISNLIADGNRANFTLTRAISLAGTGIVDNVKVMGCNNGGMVASSGTHIVSNCELTDVSSNSAFNLTSASQEVNLVNCVFHDNGSDALTSSQPARLIVINCVFDTTTGVHISSPATASDSPIVTNCTFYNASGNAVLLQVDAPAVFTNCVFESNGTYGIATSAAGIADSLIMRNCAFYNNGTAPYDTAKVLAMNVSGEVLNTTGTFFVDGPNMNFAPNATANQGALIRNLAVTLPGGLTTYRDLGAIQHQDSGGGSTTYIYNVME